MKRQCLICGESHRDSPQIKHCHKKSPCLWPFNDVFLFVKGVSQPSPKYESMDSLLLKKWVQGESNGLPTFKIWDPCLRKSVQNSNLLNGSLDKQTFSQTFRTVGSWTPHFTKMGSKWGWTESIGLPLFKCCAFSYEFGVQNARTPMLWHPWMPLNNRWWFGVFWEDLPPTPEKITLWISVLALSM